MKPDDDTRGYFITFEGSEGSGKTTQMGAISDKFTDAGYEILLTREPGGTRLGEEIRHILKHAASGVNISPEAELLLFAASRAQLVRESIQPALAKGKMVLCDRFMDSTTVYQGLGRQIQEGPVQMINTFAVGDVIPDLTIVIDIPAELGFERIQHRVTDLPDRMEEENIDFYEKVRQGYLVLAKALPERFVVVDGTQSQDEVTTEIWKQIRKRVI